ncbi:Pentatricopeptide repeat-containing protein -mitochondrial [Striga hermonthica]|uniref:Pentatricopeptide repeat-containing protein -mitochondrial n=1 Tax=Striga hermonthica TaxID=68872 RepID=A0A9N7N8E9_STRHE|nr:Pentatricopeptide repeat-containing protein -mitochondrial [Striga hermonthica]
MTSLSPYFLSKLQTLSSPYSSASLDHQKQDPDDRYREKCQSLHESENLVICSPARVRKLIASQSDPLLAMEIFDLASRQPNFRHSYAAYHTLLLKLGNSRHFSHMEALLSSLKTKNYSISPSLFSHVIKIYGEAKRPEKALKSFYSILEFNIKPSTKHLNSILEILVADSKFLKPAFDLFRSAHKHGVHPNTVSYNIMMRAFCLNGDLSIAYTLFNQMFKRDVLPDVETYRILMQGLCRKSQVNGAVDLLEDMLNKGFVPDTLSYTTLLNSLCRKKKLREAYKLLCRMKVKGCNPDIVHYNTVIAGYCKAGRAADACKVLEDMPSKGCLPNLVSYQNIVVGLCNQGMHDEAKGYVEVMVSKKMCPHFSVLHMLVRGFCKAGRIEDACDVLSELLRHGNSPHEDTWAEIIPRICEVGDVESTGDILKRVLKVEIRPGMKIVDISSGLEEYLMKKIKTR